MSMRMIFAPALFTTIVLAGIVACGGKDSESVGPQASGGAGTAGAGGAGAGGAGGVAGTGGNSQQYDASPADAPARTGVWIEAVYDVKLRPTWHNDTDQSVFLPGCTQLTLEMLKDGTWAYVMVDAVCVWEGYAVEIAAHRSRAGNFFSPSEGAGDYRVTGEYRTGCTPGQPLSTGGCTSGPIEVASNAVHMAPTVCGDPAAKARYSQCSATTDASSCASAGGTWTAAACSGCVAYCACPTGDVGCPCAGVSDCVQRCVWKPADAALALDVAACNRVATGACAPEPADGSAWVWVENGNCALAATK
jgi:hypothetical protein